MEGEDATEFPLSMRLDSAVVELPFSMHGVVQARAHPVGRATSLNQWHGEEWDHLVWRCDSSLKNSSKMLLLQKYTVSFLSLSTLFLILILFFSNSFFFILSLSHSLSHSLQFSLSLFSSTVQFLTVPSAMASPQSSTPWAESVFAREARGVTHHFLKISIHIDVFFSF